VTDRGSNAWPIVPLGQLGQWGSGGTPRRGVDGYYKGSIPWLKIGDLTDGVVTTSEESISEAGLRNSAAKLVEPGTLLIAMYGSIGKLGIPAMQCATNQAIASCAPDRRKVSTDYLFHALLALRSELIAQGKGGTQSNISQTVLKAFGVPLPPLPVQERLVTLARRTSETRDQAQAHLGSASHLLVLFRQSVLAAASSGRLTEDWRAQRNRQDDDLPGLWREVSFGDVCLRVTVGHVGKMVNEYRSQGIPFLRSMNVRELRFDRSGLKFISPVFHRRLAKSALQPGDIVVVRSGFVGTACVIPPDLGEANCSDLVIARPRPDLRSDYGAIYVNSERMKAHIAEVKVGSAQSHFNTKSMHAALLLLPPLDEQDEIVRRVNLMLAAASGLGTRVAHVGSTLDLAMRSSLVRVFTAQSIHTRVGE